jgi:ribosomal-protein-serine acetyltransferase
VRSLRWPKADHMTTDSQVQDKAFIDKITTVFFDSFSNRGGAPPKLDRLYDLFIPEAIIIKNVGTVPEIYDLDGFIAPRRALLTNGSLVDFSEWETSERTDIFGNVAQRFSPYGKSWSASGDDHKGAGVNVFQFVRTPTGWKISSLAWDDEK